MNTQHFHELRQNLANARHELRAAKDSHATALAEATQRAQVTGKNKEERDTALALALHADEAYRNALQYMRRLEYEVERIEALLESACDDRRASEWQIRARLADGLFRANVQTDHSDAAESAFDDAVDAALDDGYSHGDPNSRYYAQKPRPQPTYSMLDDEECPF